MLTKDKEAYIPLEMDEVPKFVALKALTELGESDKRKSICLKELKLLILGEPLLRANTSDEFLIKFLRVRKYDVERAFCLLKKYYKHRQTYPSLYEGFTPVQTIRDIQWDVMTFLPFRTANGSAIFTFKIDNWNPDATSTLKLLRTGTILQEYILWNTVTQICGVESVIDLEGMTWTHLYHCTPSALKCFATSLQDCLPLRQKAIHVVNHPAIFYILFQVLKPMLGNKLKSRIYLHGSDLSNLHKHIPPKILPKYLGGTLDDFKPDHFSESFLSSNSIFEEYNSYGFKS